MATTTEKLREMKTKIHWFVIPLLITLLTWVIVTLYSTKEEVSVLKVNSSYSVSNQTSMMETQKEIMKVARESRGFSMQNNEILTRKADRADVENIQNRLKDIEFKVDKIYNRKTISFGEAYIERDTIPYFYAGKIVSGEVIAKAVVAEKIIVKDTTIKMNPFMVTFPYKEESIVASKNNY